MVKIDALDDSCQRYLSAEGRLSRAIPGFVARSAQVDLAEAIARAINKQSILIAEAGTGTGKTFAYLLPCLLSGKKAIISTATKTLQDQLFQKDLPTMIKALGLSVRVQNLKGRANYICTYRVNLNAEEGQFQSPQSAHEIVHVRSKLSQMREGTRSELPEIKEDSTVWPYVTSTTDNCLGQECPDYKECFLVKARKRALEADVVVINHHLFFADSRLKREGLSELLPGAGVVVFDEAHQLEDIVSHFQGQRLGTKQFRELLDDTIKEWPVTDLANQPLNSLNHKLNQILDEFFKALPTNEERLSWDVVHRKPNFKAAVDNLSQFKEDLLACFKTNEPDKSQEQSAGLIRCKERLLDLEQILSIFAQDKSDTIRWIERFKQTLVFHSTPYDVSEAFSTILKSHACAYVFTSATLTMASAFECFSKPLGIDASEQLLLASPFDYKQQAILYLPRGLPDPKQDNFYTLLLEKVLPVIEACGGRCFFLFTSHRALKLVASLLKNRLNFPLLIQGDEAKPILLERFRQLGNAVLLGTATFWEGVDVKGEALSCVIIDKIPFTSPSDPIISGRMSYLKRQGLSAFDELSLPGAVIALKQGVGRLIRDITDKGVLVIADPRLTAREYGRAILSSLPSLTKTRDEAKVLAFIKDLALDKVELPR